MNKHAPAQRRPVWLATSLAGVFCALVLLAASSRADTLRTEVYRAATAGADSQAFSSPRVYMQVSIADAVVDAPSGPANRVIDTGSDRFARLEFFLDPRERECTLTKVRFRNSADALSSPGHVRSVYSSKLAGPFRPQAMPGCGDEGLVIDLPRAGGVGPGAVLGLIVELPPAQSRGVSLDEQFAGGRLRAEVEVSSPKGRFWVVAIRASGVNRLPVPSGESILSLCGPSGALTSSPTNQAAAAGYVSDLAAPAASLFLREADPKASSVLPCGRRAREPPTCLHLLARYDCEGGF